MIVFYVIVVNDNIMIKVIDYLMAKLLLIFGVSTVDSFLSSLLIIKTWSAFILQ